MYHGFVFCAPPSPLATVGIKGAKAFEVQITSEPTRQGDGGINNVTYTFCPSKTRTSTD